jgi:hypothetical protein
VVWRFLCAVAEIGARARQMLDEKFTKAQAIAHWTELVDQLGTEVIKNEVTFAQKSESSAGPRLSVTSAAAACGKGRTARSWLACLAGTARKRPISELGNPDRSLAS